MKSFLLALTAALTFLVFGPTEARADHGHRRFIGHDHCGSAIYSVRYLAGYDYHGCPVYRWRTEVCRPHVLPRVHLSFGHHGHGHHGHHGHGHGHGH